MEHNKSLNNLHVKERETVAAMKVKKSTKWRNTINVSTVAPIFRLRDKCERTHKSFEDGVGARCSTLLTTDRDNSRGVESLGKPLLFS